MSFFRKSSLCSSKWCNISVQRISRFSPTWKRGCTFESVSISEWPGTPCRKNHLRSLPFSKFSRHPMRKNPNLHFTRGDPWMRKRRAMAGGGGEPAEEDEMKVGIIWGQCYSPQSKSERKNLRWSKGGVTQLSKVKVRKWRSSSRWTIFRVKPIKKRFC